HGAGTCSALAVAHVDVRERDTGGDLEVRLRIRVDRLLHEVYPDRKRRTRAAHAVRVPAVETHPHQRQQSRRVADEPRVAAVVGGAGLARDDLGEPARMHCATRARCHDALEKGGHQPGLGRRNDPHRFFRARWLDLLVAELDVRIADMVAGRTPPFARGRYARASSSGVTSNAPSAIAGTGASCPWMPRARAISITVGSPTVWAMRTVAELSDCSSACRTVTIPSYRSSELRGLQGCPPDSTVIGRSSTRDAAVKNGAPSAARKAARYTIGLKAEPGWRWAEVTRLNWLLR